AARAPPDPGRARALPRVRLPDGPQASHGRDAAPAHRRHRRRAAPLPRLPGRAPAPLRLRRAAVADRGCRCAFDVWLFETGEPTLDYVRRTRADLAIVNVYLKGKLGVEVTE